MLTRIAATLMLLNMVLCQSFGQTQPEHGDSCTHAELELAHYYLELSYTISDPVNRSNALLKGNISEETLFNEFFRLLTLTQAKYPDHHLEIEFYDKAIQIANWQQNLGASAYLIQQKNNMIQLRYGDDHHLVECHCGKCTRHED